MTGNIIHCIYGVSADITYFFGICDTALSEFTNTDLEICGPFQMFILIANRQRTDNTLDNRQPHSNGIVSCVSKVLFSSRKLFCDR